MPEGSNNPIPTEFAQVWGVLALAYPNWARERDAAALKETLRLYWQLLSDIPMEQLKQAALRHIAASRFFPTVAELRESTATLLQAPAQTALEAWGEVTGAMSDARYYVYADHCNVPEFANPITNRLVASMGWRNLCNSDNVIADRARFTAAYDTLVQRQQSEAALPDMLQAGAAAQPQQLTGAERVKQLTGGIASARRLP